MGYYRKGDGNLRKIILVLFATLLLTACNNNSKVSFTELEIVPEDIQDAIDSESTLQLIYERENIAYVVYQSNGEVGTDIEEQGDTVKIKLDTKKDNDDVIVQRVYKLTLDEKHNTIDMLLNGQSKPFDLVTGSKNNK